jgi:hypothetical protein
MTRTEDQSSDDHMMMTAFGTLNPSIATLPHCICPVSPTVRSCILDVVGAKGGLWGGQPQFDEIGDYYIPPWETDHSKFVLWETPANQSLILQDIRIVAEFTKMIIDTRTSAEVLEKTYSYDFVGGITFPVFLDQVKLWMDDLRWALIPLEGEIDFDLFVVRKDLAVWADEVRSRLIRQGYKAFALTPGKNRFHWIE